MTVYTANETIGSKNEAINLSNNAKKGLVLIKPDLSITKPSLVANLNVSKATNERALDELKQASITSLKESKCKEFNNLAGMFSNWKIEIINSFIRFGDKRLHNGYLEGMNNKIKVIKRIAYGYTNFYHFRNRIMHIVNNEAFELKIIDRTKIIRKKRKK